MSFRRAGNGDRKGPPRLDLNNSFLFADCVGTGRTPGLDCIFGSVSGCDFYFLPIVVVEGEPLRHILLCSPCFVFQDVILYCLTVVVVEGEPLFQIVS